VMTRSPGGVAQLGSAHGDGVGERQAGEERMGHRGQRDRVEMRLPTHECPGHPTVPSAAAAGPQTGQESQSPGRSPGRQHRGHG